MMQNDMIITKGSYTHAHEEQLLSPKQYMFVRKADGKKQLLLRFENENTEACCAFEFALIQMDAKGAVIRQDFFGKNNVSIAAGATYAYDDEIVVAERCTDFRVELVTATFGNYVYRVKNAGVLVTYKNAKELESELHNSGNEGKRTSRRHRMSRPWICVLSALLILFSMFLAASVVVYDYIADRKAFSLDGVQYEFVGMKEIEITGYNGLGGNMLLSGEIDGNRVVGIRDGAFKENYRIKNVRISGIDTIPDDAFAGCEELRTVDFGDVKYIGEDAFKQCKKLTGLSSETLLEIGENAFTGCVELKTISITGGGEAPALTLGNYVFSHCYALQEVVIDRYIEYPSNVDIFYYDTAVRKLHLYNYAYTEAGEEPPVTEPPATEPEPIDTEPPVAEPPVTEPPATDPTPLPPEEETTPPVASPLNLGSLFGRADRMDLLALEDVKITYIDGIGEGFCANIESLKSFTIENGTWTEMPAKAFYNCRSLSNLSLPCTMTKIGEGALYHTALTTFAGEKLIYIGDYAFENCTSLTGVGMTLESEITYIGERAFAGCAKMKAAYIPLGITTLNEGIYAGCTSLISVSFDTDSTITYIPAELFRDCSSLVGLSLPKGVTTIGKYAFSGCSTLFTVPMTSSLTTIGEGAFEKTGISVLRLPEAISSVGFAAFRDCNRLTDVTVYYLGESATTKTNNYFGYIFGVKKDLTGEVPASVKKITLYTDYPSLPDHAFHGCSGVKNFPLSEDLSRVGKYAFYGCDSLTDASVADILGREEVTSVGDYAFGDCDGLTTVTIPTWMRSVPVGLLKNCDALTSVAIHEEIMTLGNECFMGCTALPAVALPASVYEIGASVFEGCTSITELILPEKLGYIGARAFAATNLTSMTIPSMVVSMENAIFADCTQLVEVILPFVGKSASSSENSHIGWLFVDVEDPALKDLSTSNLLLPASLAKVTVSGAETSAIATGAFDRCVNIREVFLKDGVTWIDTAAFVGCTRLNYIYISENVTTLATDSFMECYRLFEVTSLTSAANVVDSGAIEFALEVRYEEADRSPRIEVNGCTFAKYNWKWYLADYQPTMTDIVTPAVLLSEEKEVTWDIPVYFFYRQNIVSFTAQGGLAEIGAYAFAMSETLKTVTLPDSMQNIGDSAFSGCIALEKAILSGTMQNIGDEAFRGCSALSEVVFPNIMKTIGANAFADCVYLEKVEIRGTLQEIGNSAFSGCEELRFFIFSGEMGNIGENAFANCYYLETVDISGRMGNIGMNAFSGCTELKQVHVNGTMGNILDRAFAGCVMLEKMTVEGIMGAVGTEAFFECRSLAYLTLGTEYMDRVSADSFAGCYALISVTLPADFNEIADNAFADAAYIYDVFYCGNDHVITAGSTAYGGVARNAVVIHKNLSDTLSEEKIISTGYGEYVLRQWKGHVLLLSYNGWETNIDFENLVSDLTHLRIQRYAFDGNGDIENISFGNHLVDIGEGAFQNCRSLRTVIISSGAPITAIADNAFNGCTNLRTVTLSDNIRTIGMSSFENCISLEQVTLPRRLADIGTRAFASCGRLLSITIPQNVTNIGSEAFVNCTMLWEVIDLAYDMTFRVGSTNNGYVAYYCSQIFTSASSGLLRAEKDGYTFVENNGRWYLYSSPDQENVTLITIPKITQSYSVTILSGAIENVNSDAIVIPDNVTSIEEGAIVGYERFGIIYYGGTASDWNNLTWSAKDWLSPYFYNECVHAPYTWTYRDGQVSTSYCNLVSRVVKEPTCQEEGLTHYICECGCGYYESETIKTVNHQYKDDVCVMCGRTRTPLTDEMFEAWVQNGYIVNDEANPFEMVDGVITSTNHEDNSSSTIIFKASRDMEISFRVATDSEWNADVLWVITSNSSRNYSGEGTVSAVISVALKAGEFIEFTFQKDYEGSEGADCAYIKDLYILM